MYDPNRKAESLPYISTGGRTRRRFFIPLLPQYGEKTPFHRQEIQSKGLDETDISAALEIARLLKQMPEEYKHRALYFFLLYKYTDFDLNQPFQEQYEQNNKRLITSLEAMIS